MAAASTKVERPALAKHDASVLDLAFVMDCTGSMGSYIESARQNIQSIVEDIVTSEKSDIHLALIEYRDHPPQETTFVTRVHDFTKKVKEMKDWLNKCEASGGGDTPEAVTDALHAALKLSWRQTATKICILISDAPPHGLDPSNGDGFPNGDPSGLDPLKVVREMAEKQITLYAVGVEPPIVPYRDFFMTLAYITGGQYVPMINAKLLAQVIIGGVKEEISLERLMQNAEEDIRREIERAERETADEVEIATRVNEMLRTKNMRVKQMTNLEGKVSTVARESYSKCADLSELRSQYKVEPMPDTDYGEPGRMAYGRRGVPRMARRHAPMSEEMEDFAAAPPPPPAGAAAPASSERSYALKEDEIVSMEQTERIVQRMRSKR